MGRSMKIQIALPFLFIMTSLLLPKLINFQPALTPNEMRLLKFVPEKIDIYERQPLTLSGDLKSPVEIVKAPAKGFPSIPLSAVAPQTPAEAKPHLEPALKVSMIVLSEGRRMAIVNGLVIKEGDSVAGMRVTKIEKNRILLKEVKPSPDDKPAETRWIYLEEKK